MQSFKNFMNDMQQLSEYQLYESLNATAIFTDLRLDMIEDVKASDETTESEVGQRFRVTGTTKKGSAIDLTVGLNGLLSISFIKTLHHLSIS